MLAMKRGKETKQEVIGAFLCSSSKGTIPTYFLKVGYCFSREDEDVHREIALFPKSVQRASSIHVLHLPYLRWMVTLQGRDSGISGLLQSSPVVRFVIEGTRLVTPLGNTSIAYSSSKGEMCSTDGGKQPKREKRTYLDEVVIRFAFLKCK